MSTKIKNYAKMSNGRGEEEKRKNYETERNAGKENCRSCI